VENGCFASSEDCDGCLAKASRAVENGCFAFRALVRSLPKERSPREDDAAVLASAAPACVMADMSSRAANRMTPTWGGRDRRPLRLNEALQRRAPRACAIRRG
jgi:hypothetical protein